VKCAKKAAILFDGKTAMKNIYVLIVISLAILTFVLCVQGEVKYPAVHTIGNPVSIALQNTMSGWETGDPAPGMNPASLSGIPYPSVMFAYTRWPSDITATSMFVPFRVAPWAAIGIQTQQLSASNPSLKDGWNENYHAQSTALSVAVTPEIIKEYHLSGIGVSGRYISETLDKEHAGYLLADIGMTFSLEEKNKSQLGIAYRNIGSQPSYVQREGKSLESVCIGINRCFFENKQFIAGVNEEFGREMQGILSVGVEYKVPLSDKVRVSLMSGYATGWYNGNDGKGLAAGIGIMSTAAGVSYAYRQLSDRDCINLYEVKYQFTAIAGGKTNRSGKMEESRELNTDASNESLSMKDSYESALKMVEEERDKVLFMKKVNADDVKKVDRNRNLAGSLAREGAYEEAWVMLKYAYTGYQSLANQVAAQELLEEMEKDDSRPASQTKVKVSDDLSLYRKGLQAYLAKDMEMATRSLSEYIQQGNSVYKEKACAIAANAFLQLGMEYYRKGDILKASRNWRAGLNINPEYKELVRSINEIIKPKCSEYFNAGMAAYSQGNIRKAEEMWRTCLELDPSYERAEKAIKRLK